MDYSNRKYSQRQLRKARESIKPDSCILCKSPNNILCHSHTVPQMVLKNICDNGVLYQSSKLTETSNFLDINKGIKACGTFRLLCSDCDKQYFKDYESLDSIINPPSDIMLAEIALKNSLFTYDRQREYKALLKQIHRYQLPDDYVANYDNVDLNIRDAIDDIDFYKTIIEKEEVDGFYLLTRHVLDYTVPIATQSSVVLDRDIEGKAVNIIRDFPIVREKLQAMQLLVFPLNGKSVILAFYHKRDRKYRDLRHQFNRISPEKQLTFINYMIFAYTENYFFAPSVSQELFNNPALIELSKQVYPQSQLDRQEVGHQSISMFDIPNFLSKEYALY